MKEYFSSMIGTLAVILVIAFFIGGSDVMTKFHDDKRKWKVSVIFGVLGGIFGIYGNISGIEFNGAIISVRDIALCSQALRAARREALSQGLSQAYTG